MLKRKRVLGVVCLCCVCLCVLLCDVVCCHDLFAVTEHRLIPARARNEWSRLREVGMSSVSARASQESSHVGAAGVEGFFDRSGAYSLLLVVGFPFGSSGWLPSC